MAGLPFPLYLPVHIWARICALRAIQVVNKIVETNVEEGRGYCTVANAMQNVKRRPALLVA